MFDPADDFVLAADGHAAVALVRAGGSSIDVPHALRQAVRRLGPEFGEPRSVAGEAVWHLPASETGSPPRPGDVVIDANGRGWTLLDVRAETLGSRWRCAARDIAAAFELTDAIDVERAIWTKGPSGVPEAAWSVWRSGVAARIEPIGGSLEQPHQARAARQDVRVYLAGDVPLKAEHRLRSPDGAIYAIRAWRAATLGRPMEVDATQLTATP